MLDINRTNANGHAIDTAQLAIVLSRPFWAFDYLYIPCLKRPEPHFLSPSNERIDLNCGEV